jgi:hypothetical protein
MTHSAEEVAPDLDVYVPELQSIQLLCASPAYVPGRQVEQAAADVPPTWKIQCQYLFSLSSTTDRFAKLKRSFLKYRSLFLQTFSFDHNFINS